MTGKRVGVPLSGRDCHVALCAPRNDRRGVRAARNDKGSPQCTVHSPQFRSGTFAHGAFLCSVEIAASRFALLAMTGGAFALRTGRAFTLLVMTCSNAVCTPPCAQSP
ncbi:MAG: hypothetical protein LBL66_09980 [Clostridiales bacterium]|nr:hypothetical protein [Clostridiales bacterium]